ncbi:hypothetical protein KC333_g2901 [Hortaea werneckii]|nr:hypothetical protein KC333_g2901 [Hortaea werneckii]KAI7324050.1 hypothetical protein KC326_g1238 [Hortaea werneckii]
MDHLPRKTELLELIDITLRDNSGANQEVSRASEERTVWSLYYQGRGDEKIKGSLANCGISRRELQIARDYEYALHLQNHATDFEDEDDIDADYEGDTHTEDGDDTDTESESDAKAKDPAEADTKDDYDNAVENGSEDLWQRLRDAERRSASARFASARIDSALKNIRDMLAEISARERQLATLNVQPTTASCIACMEMVSRQNLAKVPCGHTYCHGCVSKFFTNAMTDESLFPPRCCGEPLLLEAMAPFLGKDLASRFSAKAVEFSTSNRLYCHDANCAAFIPPQTIKGETAECPDCKQETCTTCKAASHQGDCPQDTALQQVLSVAQDQGWQTCTCGRMLIHGGGCDHMTCVCGHQFCYNCGRAWKTCTCDSFDE